ncbi:hypothetical protein ACR3K2_20020 [Cryptosporidium serpentis]
METKSAGRLKISKKKLNREGCWDKEQIQKGIDELSKKLRDSDSSVSKSKRKRILARLIVLKKGLSDQVKVGGQIPKSNKTIRRLNKNKNKQGVPVKQDRNCNKNLVCLCCRKKGHLMADCRNYKENNLKRESESKILLDDKQLHKCFNCGEEGHTLRDCKKLRIDDSVLPFASCFKCGEYGHIVAYCPQNDIGSVYPKGGSCNICGSVKHLAKNCDKGKKPKKVENNTLPTSTSIFTDINKQNDPDLMWNL